MVKFECEGYIYVKYYDQHYKKNIQTEDGDDESIGEKYYGVLFIDRLKLFQNKEHAKNFLRDPRNFEFKPCETHMIYRMSKTGLV